MLCVSSLPEAFSQMLTFFLIPMFSHSQRYKGYTDSYICTCMFIYYTLLLYTHLYSYMHVFTCTRLYTHTCPVYLGKLLEFPSVTRQHLKTNIKKYIYINKQVSRQRDTAGTHTEVGKCFNSILHHLPVTTDASAFSMYVSYVCGIHIYLVHKHKESQVR